jgi:pyruvate/2-oxoglutarate dehydrogenase complex dihydrolipoamide acyltransferase (E2) component
MNESVTPYHLIDLTPSRRAWVSLLNLSWRPHTMYGLLEVDVTLARRVIADHKAHTGETLSFTGYLAFCLARAVEDNKLVQAHLKNRRQLVVFDDVDIGLMVEHKIGETRALMGHVIRGANHKTYRQIHEEIRAVQSAPVPPSRGMPTWFRSAMLLPWPLSRLVRALLVLVMSRNPALLASMAGTVDLTSVGMFGGGHSGWGLTSTGASLGLVVGGIAWKPAIVQGRVEPREILNLTVVFDHDVVDGGPATRFTRRLVELIESADGLNDDPPMAAAGVEPSSDGRAPVPA